MKHKPQQMKTWKHKCTGVVDISVPVDERPLPDTFRARTGHQLKPGQSKEYDQLKDIQNYAEVNKMKLNVPKT
jgi:hypothetical protein